MTVKLNDRIRQARHEAGMSQADLARAVGTSERNIVRWEGAKNSPRFEYVAAIARATGQDVSFFEGDGGPDENEEVSGLPSLAEALEQVVRVAVRDALQRERVA